MIHLICQFYIIYSAVIFLTLPKASPASSYTLGMFTPCPAPSLSWALDQESGNYPPTHYSIFNYKVKLNKINWFVLLM